MKKIRVKFLFEDSIKHFCVEILSFLKIIFMKTGLDVKKFCRNFFERKFYKIFGRNFLLFQNHFLENRFVIKLREMFWWSFYCCKINSSKTGLQEKKSRKMFGGKFNKNFLVENVLFLRHYFSKTGCKKK